MAEVTVDIAGRSYRLGCGEGEEEHLMRLAELLDAEAQKLLRQFGSMSEGRLLLMTSLLVADRLSDAEQRIAELEREVDEIRALVESGGPSDRLGPKREKEISRQILLLAKKIEEVAGADAS